MKTDKLATELCISLGMAGDWCAVKQNTSAPGGEVGMLSPAVMEPDTLVKEQRKGKQIVFPFRYHMPLH